MINKDSILMRKIRTWKSMFNKIVKKYGAMMRNKNQILMFINIKISNKKRKFQAQKWKLNNQ